ncbi:MAG: hypothetical protein ACI4BC_04440 [Muribaculaceae bacterium]
MSEAKTYLKKVVKTCMGNDGKVTKVVEYADAAAALRIQKSCMIKFFSDFLFEQMLSHILGEKKDWEQIFNERVKEI